MSHAALCTTYRFPKASSSCNHRIFSSCRSAPPNKAHYLVLQWVSTWHFLASFCYACALLLPFASTTHHTFPTAVLWPCDGHRCPNSTLRGPYKCNGHTGQQVVWEAVRVCVRQYGQQPGGHRLSPCLGHQPPS